MVIANATGCSSIYGGSSPTCPYTKNKEGKGPAWANSLFEDNAEFGYGMNLAYQARRNALKAKVEALAAADAATKEAAEAWIAAFNDREASKAASKALLAVAEKSKAAEAKAVLADKDCLSKKSIWIFGGDGWAYDIGYGGLDHVLASGEDVNVLVLDTEVYSNTGGQASKSTNIAAVAKFASAGKRVKKKDLGMIAKSYGYVYVAQCAMGSNPAQFLKAISEAEAYHGPSLIICYAPCINHGINMTKSQLEEKAAVDCGYWQLYRYNPNGETFTLDSTADPQGDYQAFLQGETRYTSLAKTQGAEVAADLYKKVEESAKERLEGYKKLAGK
jgi:pyruvate-ferredoxin/flavodoxin oxidoreductase